MSGSYFRDWAIPGPVPPGASDTSLQHTEPHETLDAISGHFRIFQLKKGHRFSTDDVLTAWYGTSWKPSAKQVLDLGSGIGSVGMIAAWQLPAAQFVTIEAQEESVLLAQKSAAYNGLLHRYSIRTGDFRTLGILSSQETFDLILASPPYFPVGAGVLGDHPQKIACRFETRGNIDDYCAVASQHLAHAGVLACVFPVQPAHQKKRVEEAALKHGLCLLRMRNVVLKEGEPPLLALFLMMKKTDLPETLHTAPWQEPDIVIRTHTGDVHPEYMRIKMGFGFPP
jgi:tRNA1Val (adenine37-N6)-methyltransferase